MAVDDKIKEAEYFLQQINAKYPRDEMKFYLSAFLSSTKSIADYLLEDYNQKFGLNIPLDEKLTTDRFEKESQKQNNKNAQQFITFYMQELENIRKDMIGGLLLNKRNVNVHRSTTDKPLHAHVTIQETVTITDSVTIAVYDKDGNLKQIARSEPTPPPKPSETKVEVKWFFSDHMNEEIPIVCEKFLKLMKEFVNKVHQNFP